MGMRILAGILAAMLMTAWAGDAFARGGGRGGRGSSGRSHSHSYSAPKLKSTKTAKASKSRKTGTGDLRGTQSNTDGSQTPQPSGQAAPGQQAAPLGPCPVGTALAPDNPTLCR